MCGDFDWERAAAERRHAEAELQAEQHRAVAELLEARGEDKAAAILLVCEFQLVQTSDFGDGRWLAVVAVPPGYYDLVRDEIYEQIQAAAGELVGWDCYDGLRRDLRRRPVTEGWQRELLTRLSRRNPGWPTGDQDLPAIADAS